MSSPTWISHFKTEHVTQKCKHFEHANAIQSLHVLATLMRLMYDLPSVFSPPIQALTLNPTTTTT